MIRVLFARKFIDEIVVAFFSLRMPFKLHAILFPYRNEFHFYVVLNCHFSYH